MPDGWCDVFSLLNACSSDVHALLQVRRQDGRPAADCGLSLASSLSCCLALGNEDGARDAQLYRKSQMLLHKTSSNEVWLDL